MIPFSPTQRDHVEIVAERVIGKGQFAYIEIDQITFLVSPSSFGGKPMTLQRADGKTVYLYRATSDQIDRGAEYTIVIPTGYVGVTGSREVVSRFVGQHHSEPTPAILWGADDNVCYLYKAVNNADTKAAMASAGLGTIPVGYAIRTVVDW